MLYIRDVLRLALPIRALGGTAIVATVVAVALTGVVTAPWWAFAAAVPVLGLLGLGQFERYIRREARRRRGEPDPH